MSDKEPEWGTWRLKAPLASVVVVAAGVVEAETVARDRPTPGRDAS